MKRREPIKHQDYWAQVGQTVEEKRQKAAFEMASIRDLRPLKKRKPKKSRRTHGPS